MDFIICTGHTTGFDSLNQDELNGKVMYHYGGEGKCIQGCSGDT